MLPEMVPLSIVCPCWTGRWTLAAVEALRRGVESERGRLRGKPFVVVSTRHEFDYDGLMEYVELLEGFRSEDEAVEYARGCAAAARRAAAARPGYADYRWQIVEGEWSSLFDSRPDSGPVRCVFRDRFKATNGSGFDFEYVEFTVLQVGCSEIVGTELVAYLGMESEVTRYFSERGKGRGPEADPDAAIGGAGIPGS